MSTSGASIEPSFQFESYTPSDTATMTYTNVDGAVENRSCKAILVGGAGDIACKNDAGTTVVLTGLVAGGIYPISTNQILATNTTATDLVVLF
jgi:hypothetical protein